MALNTFSIVHLYMRVVGLLGVVAGLIGLGISYALPGTSTSELGWKIALGGAALVAFAFLFELRGLARLALSRRGVFGLGVLLQLLLAFALVAGVNVYSFYNYQRFDWTKDRQFTIPDSIRDQLASLRDDTDIIVHQQYVSFGQRAENRQDKYDLAAQRKIVEKVKDLAEQFQDLGPRFRVQVLDIQDDFYQEKFEKLKRDIPKLAEAIETTPESSIFFYTRAGQRIQRLSFNDIYQLDKKASQEGDNLVLNDQGLNGFVSKVLNIEERKPRVGFAVVHEFLGQDGTEDFGMQGVKKVFATRGFEGKDIILKRWGRGKPPEATVLEHEENRFEALDAQIRAIEKLLPKQREQRGEFQKEAKYWDSTSLGQINKDYAIVETQVGLRIVPWAKIQDFYEKRKVYPNYRKLSEADRVDTAESIKLTLDDVDAELKRSEDRLEKVREEQGKLRVDNLAEQRRITDLKAKFQRLLADIDLLVIPRLTILNLMRGESLSPEVHQLDSDQVEAIREFIKSGKPVMFCLGPTNQPREESGPEPTPDAIERMVIDLGVQMPTQTILFNSEKEAFVDRDERVLILGAPPEIPPVEYERLKKGHPIHTSMRLMTRAFGKTSVSDLRVRHPRPIYYLKPSLTADASASVLGLSVSPGSSTLLQGLGMIALRSDKKPDESAIILMSSAESWNDDQPFATEKRPIPQLERSKPDDPNKNTLLENRPGPFPIGVAFEAEIPDSWSVDKSSTKSPKVRIAVIGHGGIFMGETLTPMREKLLIDVSNWLLGRDALLAHDANVWRYPRVHLGDDLPLLAASMTGQFAGPIYPAVAFLHDHQQTEIKQNLWSFGAALGLPLLFVLLGMVVILIRQSR